MLTSEQLAALKSYIVSDLDEIGLSVHVQDFYAPAGNAALAAAEIANIGNAPSQKGMSQAGESVYLYTRPAAPITQEQFTDLLDATEVMTATPPVNMDTFAKFFLRGDSVTVGSANFRTAVGITFANAPVTKAAILAAGIRPASFFEGLLEQEIVISAAEVTAALQLP